MQPRGEAGAREWPLESTRRRAPEVVVNQQSLKLAASLTLLLVGSAGCDRVLSRGQEPDFRGVWDVTYDDAVEVQLRVGDRTLRGEVLGEGGSITFESGHTVEIACERRELKCPSEIWPRELSLQAVPGELAQDGTQFKRSLSDQGSHPCSPRAGSFMTAEVLSSAHARAVRTEALALTSGRLELHLEPACVLRGGSASEVVEVVLAAGFTAAKR